MFNHSLRALARRECKQSVVEVKNVNMNKETNETE